MIKQTYRIFALLLITMLSAVHAYEALPGKGYAIIDPSIPNIKDTKDKIEVVSVFSYSCGFCYQLEPHLEKWAKENSDNVEFLRMPIPGQGMNDIFARTYFSLVAIDEVDKGHIPFFDAIMDRKRFTSAKAVAKLMKDQGIDDAAFIKAWDSFTVNTNINRALDLVVKYRITSTPAVIVDGKYYVDISTANTHEPNRDQPYDQTIKVIDELVKEISTNPQSADDESK